MTAADNTLLVVGEECAEVQKVIAKILRFGLFSDYQGPTNQALLVEELNDLLGAADALVEYGILPADWQDANAQARKRVKMSKMLEYSRKEGLVTDT